MVEKKHEDRRVRYEKSGKRPGTAVTTRLSDAELKLAHRRMKRDGLGSMSAWLLTLVRRELGVNASSLDSAKARPRRRSS